MTNFINSDRIQNFNKDWKFYLGDQPGAWFPSFDDSNFENINLTHDYSINQAYSEYFEAESAYKPGGIGNYRKSFFVDDIDLEKKQVFIYFDGVYHKSTCYINGIKLGFNPYGYNPFIYDLTDYLKKDCENIFYVHVNHQIPSSRWYSGSGIYRNVDIIVKDKLNIGIYGPRIDYKLDGNLANIKISSEIFNNYQEAKTFDLKITLLFKDKVVSEHYKSGLTIDPKSKCKIAFDFDQDRLLLWDLDKPNLYQIKSQIIIDSNTIDEYISDIGFRTFEKSPETGISLNGKNIKIKGVCLHHDNGALGACEYYSAVERKIEILKDMGVNTIRLTHNPASKILIDLCNKKGMLLVSEIFDGWILDKNNNYNDFSAYFEEKIGQSKLLNSNPSMTFAEFSLKEILKRDYNAPSIFMLSIGNEIIEGTDWSRIAEYPQVSENLIKWTREIDQNRWLTVGDNIIRYDYIDELIKVDDNIHKSNGLVGLNYTEDKRYDQIHKDHPDWVLWASETASNINSRSVYDRFELKNLTKDRELSSYDISKVGWGRHASDAWYDIITRDYVSGEAIWTGFDYLGEPSPFNGIDRGAVDGWPCPRSSYFGVIDLAGFPKDSYYLYRSLWNDKDITLHLLPSWNEDEILIKEGKVKVVCYTNAQKVELVHIDEDGHIKSYGVQEFQTYATKAGHKYLKNNNRKLGFSLYFEWDIPFEKGAIKAIAYDNKNRVITNTVGRKLIKTTKDAYKIFAKTNKKSIYNDSYDLAYVEIDILDEDDNLKTSACNLLNVELSENGILLGLDNGFQEDMDSFKVSSKRAYRGKLLAIIASKYKNLEPINIKITGDNLKECELTIDVKESLNKLYLPKENKYSSINRKKDCASCDYQAILNYSTHTFPNIYPKLPEKLELIDKKGKLSGNYIDISWDEIDKNDLSKDGTILVKGYGYLKDKKLEVTSSIRIEDEKHILNANIAKHALIKEKSNNFITFGFATQQLFGGIKIKNIKKPDIKIFISETKLYEKGEKIAYEFFEDNGEYTYKFKPIKATYITILFDNKVANLEDVSLYNVKKRSTIYDTVDFSYIKINDYNLSKDDLKNDEFIFNGNIELLDCQAKDNAAITIIRKKKKSIIYLKSEDSSKIRKFKISQSS